MDRPDAVIGEILAYSRSTPPARERHPTHLSRTTREHPIDNSPSGTGATTTGAGGADTGMGAGGADAGSWVGFCASKADSRGGTQLVDPVASCEP